jgi:hypothetical protein
MKTYACDMCYAVVDNPFKNILMTEITVRQRIIGKRKVHLCENCYHQIIEVSRKKRSDNNGE